MIDTNLDAKAQKTTAGSPESGYLSTGPRLLRANAEKWPDRVWMRKKEYGFWTEYTWRNAYEQIRRFSLGLVALGLREGDRVAIVGDSDPHWFWAELAAQCAGAVVVGLFTDSTSGEIKHILTDSQASFVVAQDQEQVDKFLAEEQDMPWIKKIIYWDPSGMNRYDHPLLMEFSRVIELGRKYDLDHPGELESRSDGVSPDDLNLLIYTSGTTGLPKGVMLTWGSLLSGSWNTNFANPVSDRDDFVSFTLPGWTAEQLFGLTSSLITGMRLNFVEKPETTQRDIREIGPQRIFYPSRLWENLVSSTQHRISQTQLPKRIVYQLLQPIGYRWAGIVLQGRKPNLVWQLAHKASEWMLFHQVKDRYGLSKLKTAFTGGALLGPDMFQFLVGLGIDLRQVYSPTETLGGTIHYRNEVKVETVGQPVLDVELRIMDNSEILIYSNCQFKGYYGQPEATRKAFLGRWYRSGDSGYIDRDGHLVYTDRLDFIKQMADGTSFPPQYIESRLKFSPYIKDAFVVGNENTNFLAAIINIEFDNVGNWAERKSIPYTTFAELSQKPEVCELIRDEIQKVNDVLPERFCIWRFANLYKEFDPDEGELTRTRKIRRDLVEELYSELVKALYGIEEGLMLKTSIRYQDGSQGTVRNLIRINSLSKGESLDGFR